MYVTSDQKEMLDAAQMRAHELMRTLISEGQILGAIPLISAYLALNAMANIALIKKVPIREISNDFFKVYESFLIMVETPGETISFKM